MSLYLYTTYTPSQLSFYRKKVEFEMTKHRTLNDHTSRICLNGSCCSLLSLRCLLQLYCTDVAPILLYRA